MRITIDIDTAIEVFGRNHGWSEQQTREQFAQLTDALFEEASGLSDDEALASAFDYLYRKKHGLGAV